jgi:aryl-alcohol dehydrogenase-like predicted oxidoreductase
LLTGKYQPGSAPPEGSRALTQSGFSKSFTDERLRFSQTLHQMAVEHGWNASSLSLGWVLSRPGVSAVLVGATRPDQMIENLKDLERTIEDSLLSQLEEMSAPCVTTPFREGGVNPV